MKILASKSSICSFLKEELKMSYRKLKPIGYRHNSVDAKFCRQYAAQSFINLLSEGKILINIDESAITLTDNRQYGWFYQQQKNFYSHSQRLAQINMIAGVSSNGQFYYTFNFGKNNSNTFSYFLLKLVKLLDQQDKHWRKNYVFIIDNAPYHRSKKMKEFFKDLRIPIMFLGPYQYRMAPVEMMFSFIKNQDLNKLKSRGNSMHFIASLIKEMSMFVSQLNTFWIADSFSHVLTSALQSICLNDL